ncbi:MAG: putative cytosol aminopeptidase [Microgenomates group bacterium GW2011_GWC1_43_11]|nr:MAG: putative cytosol aminopeptidase [Microgenomates group bacterium GW2011_GWC1_43_11]
MKCTITTDKTELIQSDCLVIFGCWKEKVPFLLFNKGKKVDQPLSSLIANLTSKQEFEGKVGKTLLIHTNKQIQSNHVLIAGVGDVKKLSMKDWLDVMAAVGREAKKIRATHVAVVLEEEIRTVIGAEKTARGIVEGMTLGTYEFNRYKKMEKKEHAIDIVSIISKTDQKALSDGIRFGEILSKGTIITRDLVNEPSSVTTPTFLANFAHSIARNDKNMTCDVLEKKDMEKLGMGGILGIARGSDEEPKLIKLTFRCHPDPPDGGEGSHPRQKKTIVLVGKGVTFDSGGLSLKSQEGMETMKIDMAGAAAILGIFSVISELEPNATVIGLIPAVENMPSGKAIKPGDVVRAYNGKTIEVISTDAEGRVILADALAWAGETMKPDIMIDLATLTGACMIALGEDIAGLFATDGKLGESLKQSAVQSGEAVWELPMPESYNDLLKSDVADIRNVTRKRYGGAITAALFLKAFVPDGIPWAHIDIAGPAIAEKNALLTPVGGTGFGVRLIVDFLLKEDKEEGNSYNLRDNS